MNAWHNGARTIDGLIAGGHGRDGGLVGRVLDKIDDGVDDSVASGLVVVVVEEGVLSDVAGSLLSVLRAWQAVNVLYTNQSAACKTTS